MNIYKDTETTPSWLSVPFNNKTKLLTPNGSIAVDATREQQLRNVAARRATQPQTDKSFSYYCIAVTNRTTGAASVLLASERCSSSCKHMASTLVKFVTCFDVFSL